MGLRLLTTALRGGPGGRALGPGGGGALGAPVGVLGVTCGEFGVTCGALGAPGGGVPKLTVSSAKSWMGAGGGGGVVGLVVEP